ncbi:alpha/beta-hydrolase [Coemansia reversa NRRL 1564]|uniref:Dipeptidyl-peptidase V n=1 Tax=Coemansia reversa (strain ATCC 12441 / NRRL 1564) TaxID=763665 RepID=A0A2G5B623_COERN|nr:alpha/beta-hydrolase [Coemansia reversa NRRL 1564]|eukprot:PIA14493.1 alpha/beta-hydrolase [Coemansia reversa NRRL 1564]
MLVYSSIFCVAKGDIASSTGRTRPLDIKTFHSLNRLGAPVISPNQKQALFTTSCYDAKKNRTCTYLSYIDIVSGNITQLTDSSAGSNNPVSNPLWFDNQTVGFLRQGALYMQTLHANSSVSIVYNPLVPISNVIFHGDTLTFIAAVFPNATLEQSAELRKNKPSDSSMVFDNLWARHWDAWMTTEKPTLFAARVTRTEKSKWRVGHATNLAKRLPHFNDARVGWTVDNYEVDAQGQQAAFIVRRPAVDMAWATDVDIYVTPTNVSRPRLLTSGVYGAASNPAFSWDGRQLAWLQMETPGYEADINRIFLHTFATRKTVAIAYDWGQSPQSLTWSRDSSTLYAVTNDRGRSLIVAIDVATGRRKQLTTHGSATGVRTADRRHILYLNSKVHRPADLHILDVGSGASQQLTEANKDKLRDVYLGHAENFWFVGARGDRVHAWLVRPYGFNRQRRYPVALLLHGGPQQASTQGFVHGLWNPNMYASAGFVTVQLNFHGSPGYSRNFTDSVRYKWGDYPYVDVMSCIDYVSSHYNFVDSNRIVALGGSFGGYLANWLNGHTDRFCALVAHAGKFSTVSGYYSTDELWFPEHDLGKPWEPSGRDILEENNPERFAANFKTPTLFSHGERDFRIPISESLSAWAMLRRRNIPSRLVYFPGESHWITKPANAIRWYTEVLDWITSWTNTTAPYRIR